MRKSSAIFFQAVIALIGLGVLVLLLWEPHLEGRNVNKQFLDVYFDDPFLAYVYVASIVFFVGLYQTFKLLGLMGKNKTYSLNSIKALRTIKYSAIVLSVLIVLAGLYIRAFHAADDDPAGFLAICIVTTFISIIIAAVAGKFEKRLELKN
jgi:hypothetical protein